MTVAPFDILCRDTNVGHPYFLEASAGTGKTFAIEHLVVRYLLELSEPTTLDRILVVTFTRAATRELHHRIRKCIAAALEGSGDCPDYLLKWREEGQDEVVRHRLGQALASFDDAQIYTIHSFCLAMLRDHAAEAGVALDLKGLDNGLSYADQLQVVLDFFRSGLREESYSPAQIARALTLTRGDPRGLARLILKEMGRGKEVVVGRDCAQSLEALNRVLLGIEVSQEWVLEDFEKVKALYTGLRDRSRQVKPEFEAQVAQFAALLARRACGEAEFDRLVSEPIVLLDLIANGRLLRGKEMLTNLRYPWLYSWLREDFGPVIAEARDPRQILARMVGGSREMLRRTMEEQESLTFDGLLEAMAKALEHDSFLQAVGDRFGVAVVDEFQDTDPVQWSIFNRLFAQRGVPLVVVGDPKQSIYSFRNADIYAYLDARDTIGVENCRTLGVNYRSRPGLTRALNGLFSKAEGLIGLPSRGSSLPYVPVETGVQEDNELSSNGPIRIFEGVSVSGRKFPGKKTEEEQLFPFITNEMLTIRAAMGLRFDYFAVLVSDRYQGERFRRFAAERGIPVSSSRGRTPGDSPALEQLYIVYRAVLDPSDWGRVRAALSSQLIGWSVEQVGKLMDGGLAASVSSKMATLREILAARGFLPFFQRLMATVWQGSAKVAERVAERLVREDVEFAEDLYQLAEIIAGYQRESQTSADGLVAYFHELRTVDQADERAPKLLTRCDDDAVQLMTAFASKGLEFGVVFALGLASRIGANGRGLIVRSGEGLAASHESEEAAQLAADECDAEKARLLYVALTRAKDRVYVPHITDTSSRPVKPGNASPVELLLSRLGGGWENAGVTCVPATGGAALRVEAQASPHLVAPPRLAIHRVDRVMQSFTGLANPSHGDRPPAPSDRHASVKSAHTLPAGAATGILVHELLEDVPLDLAQAIQFVHSRMRGHPLEDWAAVVADVVLRALQSPIDGFTISEVDTKRMRREMEFLYGVRGGESVPLAPGCVAGVMDLFFEHKSRYYLLDWKSNWLGPDESSYNQEGLMAAMIQHDYGLQADLYAEGLKRYLALVDGRPFEECFGGAYYVFVRGPGVIKWDLG